MEYNKTPVAEGFFLLASVHFVFPAIFPGRFGYHWPAPSVASDVNLVCIPQGVFLSYVHALHAAGGEAFGGVQPWEGSSCQGEQGTHCSQEYLQEQTSTRETNQNTKLDRTPIYYYLFVSILHF